MHILCCALGTCSDRDAASAACFFAHSCKRVSVSICTRVPVKQVLLY